MLPSRQLIYNSRNYLGIIADDDGVLELRPIYNSRNYLGIIADDDQTCYSDPIYNSRNYLGIIAAKVVLFSETTSTIVEIT